MLDIQTTKTLRSGYHMPLFGLGVFKMENGPEGEKAIRHALDLGYRHIDTAIVYENEETVGKAIRDSGVPREQLWVTTKGWVASDADPAPKALDDSLRRLGLDYVDLFLIHWPDDDAMEDYWREMQKLRDDGKIRSIGVSNFTVKRFEKKFFDFTSEIPDVNQVEFHCFNYKQDLLEYCNGKHIALEAYSPIARGEKFDSPGLKELAGKYDKTPAQMMIRWCLQKDIITIPKSSKLERIKENAEVFDFEISGEDMTFMDNLDESYDAIPYRPAGFY